MTSHKADREQQRAQAVQTQQINEAAAKMDRLKAEKAMMTGAHLKSVGEDLAEDAQLVNIIVQASLQVKGLPLPSSVEEFATRAEQLAYRLTSARRTREWEARKAILDSQGEREPNAVLIAAAKRSGVSLTTALVPDAPRLVQG